MARICIFRYTHADNVWNCLHLNQQDIFQKNNKFILKFSYLRFHSSDKNTMQGILLKNFQLNDSNWGLHLEIQTFERHLHDLSAQFWLKKGYIIMFSHFFIFCFYF